MSDCQAPHAVFVLFVLPRTNSRSGAQKFPENSSISTDAAWETFSYLPSGLLLYVGRDKSIYTYSVYRNKKSSELFPQLGMVDNFQELVWPFLEFRILNHVSPGFFLFSLRMESIIAFDSLLPHDSGDHGSRRPSFFD